MHSGRGRGHRCQRCEDGRRRFLRAQSLAIMVRGLAMACRTAFSLGRCGPPRGHPLARYRSKLFRVIRSPVVRPFVLLELAVGPGLPIIIQSCFYRMHPGSVTGSTR